MLSKKSDVHQRFRNGVMELLAVDSRLTDDYYVATVIGLPQGNLDRGATKSNRRLHDEGQMFNSRTF
jgi:hypothetical protein